jgi:site-specific DNA-methyltransferase (adenine-specific)
MTTDLRLGRWQDALDGVTCDALITDPPYSERTHKGHDSGRRNDGGGVVMAHGGSQGANPITYSAWTDDDARSFVSSWAPRVRGWFVVLTDHRLAAVFESAMEAVGRYVFAPLPCVDIGSRVRLSGDGPSSWTCWAVVSRPSNREFQRWGTLPGAYVTSGAGDRAIMGGKRTDTMRAIVRDYSRPGDLICDPCAGAATTLLAARMEGRRAIGAEMDPATYAKAMARLSHMPVSTERQPALFGRVDE